MEKSRSFPEYSYSRAGYTFGEQPKSYSFNGPSSKSRSSGFASSNDPELKREKRVASYNVLTVEGKLKSSVQSNFKWIKNKRTEIRHGA